MIHYLLQIIGFQFLFLAVYEIFLKKETFFTWNRVYLLATPILSLILPFVQIPALQQSIPQTYKIALPKFLLNNANQEVAVQGGVLPEVVVNGKASLDIIEIFLNVWYAGVAVSVLLFGFKLYKIWKLHQAGKVTGIDGLRVVTIPNSTVAFSFFNTMFLGENLSTKQRESIVLHEVIHIQERHSLDLLFFEILRIIFWYNPLVYAFQNNMILLQEYTADARAVTQLDTKKYYQGLLSQVFQTENISFINTFFNHSFIKKRISMLQKSKSKQLAKFKYVLLIPVVCSMLFYVACSEDTSIEKQEFTIEDQLATIKNQLITEDQISQEEYEEYLELVQELIRLKNNSNIELDQNDFQIAQTLLTSKNKLVYMSSSEEKVDLEKVPLRDLENIPFAVVEKVPTYPGCSGSTNEELKKCMSQKIGAFVGEQFDFKIGNNLDLEETNRIFVAFRVDKDGNVTNIRSRAPHPELEKEADRVIKTLPKMQPGEQDGRPVSVLYSLPITFKISE